MRLAAVQVVAWLAALAAFDVFMTVAGGNRLIGAPILFAFDAFLYGPFVLVDVLFLRQIVTRRSLPLIVALELVILLGTRALVMLHGVRPGSPDAALALARLIPNAVFLLALYWLASLSIGRLLAARSHAGASG